MHVNGKNVTEIRRMASGLEHKSDITATLDKIKRLYVQLRKLNQELKLTRDKQKEWKLIKEKLGALSIHQLDVYLDGTPKDSYRYLRVNFNIINTGEETVKLFGADLVVNYGINERIYPIIIYNENRLQWKKSTCFKSPKYGGKSLEAEIGSTFYLGNKNPFHVPSTMKIFRATPRLS
jgi:hypothetical protein